MKDNIWECINKDKVESKPHKVLLSKKYSFIKNKVKKVTVKYKIINRIKLWKIPENF